MRKSYERTGERRRSSFPSYIYFLTILSVSRLVSSLHHLKMDGKLQHNSKVRKTWGDMTNLKNVVLQMLETWFSKVHPGS